MRTSLKRLVALAALLLAASVSAADAQRRWGEYRDTQWEVIQERQVRPGARDVVIPAEGRSGSRYTAIRVQVLDEPLFITGLSVQYGNGQISEIPVRRIMRPGDTTEPIDLEGGGRYINAIRVGIQQAPDWRRTARIAIIGDREEARRFREQRPERYPRVPVVRDDLPRGWVLFATQRANFGTDRDAIVVGRERGVFQRIALRARGNDVFVRDIIIRFGNGEVKEFPIDLVITDGSRTQDLRLERPRFIEQIDLIYASRPDRGPPALVDVFGEYAADSNRGAGDGYDNAGWQLIGAQRASMFRSDGDEYPVDPRIGRINAIRLLARKSDVDIQTITIHYASGDREVLPVNRKLNRDNPSPDIIVRGRGTGPVRGITVQHKSILSLRGEAVVEVWGRR
jgi:hypothetical protein